MSGELLWSLPSAISETGTLKEQHMSAETLQLSTTSSVKRSPSVLFYFVFQAENRSSRGLPGNGYQNSHLLFDVFLLPVNGGHWRRNGDTWDILQWSMWVSKPQGTDWNRGASLPLPSDSTIKSSVPIITSFEILGKDFYVSIAEKEKKVRMIWCLNGHYHRGG